MLDDQHSLLLADQVPVCADDEELNEQLTQHDRSQDKDEAWHYRADTFPDSKPVVCVKVSQETEKREKDCKAKF